MALHNLLGEVASEKTAEELLSELATLSFVLSSLAHSLGALSPDTSGRLRVNVESGSVSVSAVTAMNGVGTMAPLGGTVNASYDQYGQMMQGPNSNRNQIEVS